MIELLLGNLEKSTVGWDVRGPVAGYFGGLDLGQAHDFTALAIVEAADIKGAWDAARICYGRRRELRLRHLERLPLGTSYPAMVNRVVRVMESAALLNGPRHLAVDTTGVGRPVLDLLREKNPPCHIWPATITGGDAERNVDGIYRVPKRELLIGLQVMLQSGKLRIAEEVPEAAALAEEMNSMRVETSENGRDEWRSGKHDDLVFAVALACWSAKKGAMPARDWW